MIVRTKKMKDGRIVRMETGGHIKEVIIKKDLINPQRESINICFMGERSSGIIELNSAEAKDLHDTLGSKIKMIKTTKIIKEKN